MHVFFGTIRCMPNGTVWFGETLAQAYAVITGHILHGQQSSVTATECLNANQNGKYSAIDNSLAYSLWTAGRIASGPLAGRWFMESRWQSICLPIRQLTDPT